MAYFRIHLPTPIERNATYVSFSWKLNEIKINFGEQIKLEVLIFKKHVAKETTQVDVNEMIRNWI